MNDSDIKLFLEQMRQVASDEVSHQAKSYMKVAPAYVVAVDALKATVRLTTSQPGEGEFDVPIATPQTVYAGDYVTIGYWGNLSTAILISSSSYAGGGGGGGGTDDYNALGNKPQINSITLTGNKTSLDLGLYGNGNEPNYPVKSVNGKTGAVSLAAGDVSAIPLSEKPYFDLSRQPTITSGNILTYARNLENSCSFAATPAITGLPYSAYWFCQVTFFSPERTHILVDVKDILVPQNHYWCIYNTSEWYAWVCATPKGNKSFLDNAWFTQPYLVNQRGQNEYSGVGVEVPCVDRWLVGSGKATILNDSIKFQHTDGDYGDFIQKIEPIFIPNRGDIATFSVDLGGTIYSISGPLPVFSATVADGIDLIVWTSDDTIINTARIRVRGNKTINIRRAKLELGPVSTLHLDTPPSPAEQELNRQVCRRYYQKQVALCRTCGAAVGVIIPGFNFPEIMRTQPTVTIFDQSGNAGKIGTFGQPNFSTVKAIQAFRDGIGYLEVTESKTWSYGVATFGYEASADL